MSHKVVSPCLYLNCKARCGCGPGAICCSPTRSMGDFSRVHPVHGLLGGKDLFLVRCRGGNLEQGMQKACDTLFLMQHSMFPILSSFRLSALEFNYKRWEFWALWMVKPFKDSRNIPPPHRDLETFRTLIILTQGVDSNCRVLYFQNNVFS